MAHVRAKGRSAFSRLLIAFLGITLLASTALVVIFYFYSKNAAARRVRETVTQQLGEIERLFVQEHANGVARVLRRLNSSPVLEEYLAASEVERIVIGKKLERLFAQTIDDFQSIQSVSFFDALGVEAVGGTAKDSVAELNQGQLPKATEQFLNTLSKAQLGSIHVEGPLTDQTGRSFYLAAISKLDTDTGKLGGVVLAKVNLESFFNYLSGLHFQGENTVWVYGPHRAILKQPANSSVTFDGSAAMDHSLQSRPNFAEQGGGVMAYRDLSMLDGQPFLRVAVSVSSKLLLKDTLPILRFFAMIFVLSMGAVFVASFYVSRHFSQPIVDLARAADRLAKGDLSSRMEQEAGGEIQMLIDSFNHMAFSLEAREAEIKSNTKDLQARYQEILTLKAIGEIILGAADLAPVPRLVLERTMANGAYDLGNIRLLDRSGQSLEVAASQGYKNAENTGAHRRLVRDTVTGKFNIRGMSEGEARVEPDLNACEGLSTLKKEGIVSAIVVPVQAHGEVLGVIQVGCRAPRDFQPSEVNLLLTVGTQIGIAVQKARLFDDLKASKEEVEEANRALAVQSEELALSNRELEQFAYVASHDLQEPLRMVQSYTQLLRKRYYDKLDADANEFIAYAVEGAGRMQKLILDLLGFSRVGTRTSELASTNCDAVLSRSLLNLRVALEESGTTVHHDAMPTLMADESQLGQLFQNLIGNAIKFRNGMTPEIRVSAQRENGHWLFAVKDNGIGIDPAYSGRIFDIFQRLHSRDEYEGTGIGLAVCKKIVERHGGKIWVESAAGHGSTFYFTIPA